MDIVFHSLAATKGRINDRSFVDDAELAENLPIVSCGEVLAFFAGRRRESVGCVVEDGERPSGMSGHRGVRFSIDSTKLAWPGFRLQSSCDLDRRDE